MFEAVNITGCDEVRESARTVADSEAARAGLAVATVGFEPG